MKYCTIVLLLCLPFPTCRAQDNKEVLSHIPKSGRSLTAFIPKGYDTLAMAAGDLNRDGKQDVVMVLKDLKEDSDGPGGDARGTNRVILVLFKTDDGWSLAAKAGDVVLCKDCGGVFGDPFAAIRVANGIIIVDHYGGSSEKWAVTRKFKYRDGDFYLIGKTDATYFGNDFCEKQNSPAYTTTDINLLTGDREMEELSKECKLTKKKDKIAKAPLVKMADCKCDF